MAISDLCGISPVRDVPPRAESILEKYQRVILEIGVGETQSPYLNDENIEHYKNANLIRTDLFVGNESGPQRRHLEQKFGGFGGSGHLNGARERDKKRIEGLKGSFEGKIYYMSFDAKNMPLEDEAVDEVYTANMFSAPGFWRQERNAILLEMKRVLKNSGELILAETYTPQCALEGVDRDSGRKSFGIALCKYVKELSAVADLLVKTIEFPKYSKEADERRDEGRNVDQFLSQYPYGKRMFGNYFIPCQAAPNPNYKFIIVFTKNA